MIFNTITILISLAALGLSIWNAVREVRANREQFDVRIVDYVEPGDYAVMLLCISNRSAKPLAITSITCEGIQCELEPVLVKTLPATGAPVLSAQFPLYTAALGASVRYIQFPACPHTPLAPGEALTLQIQTTRHSVSKTVILGNTGHYLHTTSLV